MIPWHRIFGMTLTDFFSDTSYKVEVEKDLSLRKQLLDVVVLERKEGAEPEVVPDGLEDMAAHNLITFKSHRQSLNHWAVEDLAGHYVNYRKQASPSAEKLLPAEDFNLYAVCSRFPRKLSEQCELTRFKDGVYDFKWGVRTIPRHRNPTRRKGGQKPDLAAFQRVPGTGRLRHAPIPVETSGEPDQKQTFPEIRKGEYTHDIHHGGFRQGRQEGGP